MKIKKVPDTVQTLEAWDEKMATFIETRGSSVYALPVGQTLEVEEGKEWENRWDDLKKVKTGREKDPKGGRTNLVLLSWNTDMHK